MSEPLVLLHGFTQTARAWDGVLAAGAAERYRATVPDLRGHGTASAMRPVGWDEVLADVGALIEPRTVLAGYSMGARIALRLALEHHDRIDRLVLVSANAGLRGDEERDARRAADEALARQLERDGLDAFLARWAALPLWDGMAATAAAAAQRDRRRNDAEGLAAALRGLGAGTMAPVWSRLPGLDVPVTLVAGERDARYRALAGDMHSLLPRSRVVVAPRAGHAVPLERPDTVAAALDRWQPHGRGSIR